MIDNIELRYVKIEGSPSERNLQYRFHKSHVIQKHTTSGVIGIPYSENVDDGWTDWITVKDSDTL